MKYICSNCGNIQDTLKQKSGCAHAFWGYCIIITILISLFWWVGFVVLAFVILFFILTNGKVNCCHRCNAACCVVPVNSPRGKKIFNEYYEYEEDNLLEELKPQTESCVPNKNECTITKIKIQKSKTWCEILEDNKNTVIVAILGLFVIGIFGFIIFPLMSTHDTPTAVQKIEEKIEVAPEKQSVEAITSTPITFENSPEQQAQYKVEIEKAINNGVIKAKKEIDREYDEANNFYLSIIENDNYTQETFDKMESYTRGLVDPVFWLYVDLEKITEKYTNKKSDLATDSYWVIAEYVEPIMKKYNVNNLQKVTNLIDDLDKKYEELEARTEGIRRIIYGEN